MTHPYEQIAGYRRWDRGVAAPAPAEVDPVVEFPARITPEQQIVTAGSCFAQHIARYLRRADFRFLVTEPGHPAMDEAVREAHGYGVFSARFGNIYTSRQLEQLFRRAYGLFEPADSVWPGRRGGFADPFRPAIEPAGFATSAELLLDRKQHLAAVRRAFEELDVFIFTLGLTECWAAADGAVFPLAPGVAGGVFDPDRYHFVNLSASEVVADMARFVEALRSVNSSATVILTVSPVPLIATGVDRHVLVSTIYSKSVLRVAAEELTQTLPGVHYFPAFEVVTGNFSRGAYYDDDLRSVRESGVRHVMSLFFRHATTVVSLPDSLEPPAKDEQEPTPEQRAEAAIEVLCDEELLTLQRGPA